MIKIIKYWLIASGLGLLTVSSSFASDAPVAIVGATIFTSPDETPIEDGVLIFQGNKISHVGSSIQLPENTKVINAKGKFVTAGFWNSHVHYTGELEQAAAQDKEILSRVLLEMFLRWGFVNTVDTGSWLEKTLTIRDRINHGEVDGPRILIAGGSFVPVGGSPYYIKPIQLPEFKSPDQAKQLVRETLNQGADAIKLFTGSWGTPERVVVMNSEDVLAATNTAHENKALVFAHPSDSDGANVAIENGVDILAHVFPSEIKGPWDRSLPGKMAEKKMALIPTLKLWRDELTREGLSAQIVNHIEKVAIEQTKICHENGVAILFGTDVGYMRDADTTDEFRLLAKAGLNYKDILRALTTAPAAKYQLADTNGMIKENFDADLVILGSDPRENSLAFSDVVKTFRGGKLVYEK